MPRRRKSGSTAMAAKVRSGRSDGIAPAQPATCQSTRASIRTSPGLRRRERATSSAVTGSRGTTVFRTAA